MTQAMISPSNPLDLLSIPLNERGPQLRGLDPSEMDGFFRYEGQLYHLGQFQPLDGIIPGWDGIYPTCGTKGLLVRVTVDAKVVVGRYTLMRNNLHLN